MKTLKIFAIIILLMGAIFFLTSCGRHTYGKCEGREKMIGYGTPTKQVLKHYKN